MSTEGNYRSVIKYRVKCIGTGNHGMVTTNWIEDTNGLPTVCPVDSNDTIDPLFTSEIDRIDTNIVISEDNIQGTQGFYQTIGYDIDIPSGTPGDVTTHNSSFPYPVRVFSVTYQPGTWNIGDKFSVYAYPEQKIGVITSNVSINSNVIPLNSGAIPIVKVGFRIYIADVTNTDNLGICMSIDTANNTITTQYPTTNSFNAGSDFKISIERVKDVYISTDHPITFGANNAGGVFFQTGGTARIIYTNNDGLAKKFRYYVEITY